MLFPMKNVPRIQYLELLNLKVIHKNCLERIPSDLSSELFWNIILERNVLVFTAFSLSLDDFHCLEHYYFSRKFNSTFAREALRKCPSPTSEIMGEEGNMAPSDSFSWLAADFPSSSDPLAVASTGHAQNIRWGRQNFQFLSPWGGPKGIWLDICIFEGPFYNENEFWLKRPLP